MFVFRKAEKMKALGTIVLFKDYKTKDDMEIIINVPGHVADATKNLLGGRIKPGESRWVEISIFEGGADDKEPGESTANAQEQ